MSGQWWLAGLPHEAALSASAQQVLAALTTLTALHFHGKVTPPTNPAAALAGAAQLQLLCDKTHPAVFGPDAWPDGLRCACIYWVQLADGRWSAGFGEQLRYLRIDSWMEDWSAMQHHPAWSAFWAWAAQAADLRLVEVRAWPGVLGGQAGCSTRICLWPSIMQLPPCCLSSNDCRSEQTHPIVHLYPKMSADHWLPSLLGAAHGAVPGADDSEAAPPAADRDHTCPGLALPGLPGHRSCLLHLRRLRAQLVAGQLP